MSSADNDGVLEYLIETNRRLINNLVGSADGDLVEQQLKAAEKERDATANLLEQQKQKTKKAIDDYEVLRGVILEEREKADKDSQSYGEEIRHLREKLRGAESLKAQADEKIDALNLVIKDLRDNPPSVINPNLEHVATFIEVAYSTFDNDPDRSHRNLKRAYLAIKGEKDKETDNG